MPLGTTGASGYRGVFPYPHRLARMPFLDNRRDDTKGKGSRKGPLLKIAYHMISPNNVNFMPKIMYCCIQIKHLCWVQGILTGN